MLVCLFWLRRTRHMRGYGLGNNMSLRNEYFCLSDCGELVNGSYHSHSFDNRPLVFTSLLHSKLAIDMSQKPL